VTVHGVTCMLRLLRRLLLRLHSCLGISLLLRILLLQLLVLQSRLLLHACLSRTGLKDIMHHWSFASVPRP
jgi:hypothetical protein